MKEAKSQIALVSTIFTAIACGPTPNSKLNAVFEGDARFEILSAEDTWAKSIGTIEDEQIFGTGFLLGENRLITNYHIALNCTHDKCDLKFQNKYRLKLVSRRLVSDVAVLEVIDPLPCDMKPLQLASSYAVEDEVTIIQNGIDFIGSAALVKTQGKLLSTSKKSFGYELGYSTTTKPGSSGSPVLSRENKVIAIHKGADPVQKQNLASALADQGNLLNGELELEFETLITEFETNNSSELKYDLVEIYLDAVAQKNGLEVKFSKRIKDSSKSKSLRLYFEGIRKIKLD